MLWRFVDDLAWLVDWLSDKFGSGGVLLALEDALESLESNCEIEKEL